MARNLFPFLDNGKTLKVNFISLLARCTNVGINEYDYDVLLTIPLPSPQPPAQANMTLAPVDQYGGLFFHQMDATTLTSNIEIAPTDPPVRWQVEMTRPGGLKLQEDPVKKVMEVEDVLLVLGYEWESS